MTHEHFTAALEQQLQALGYTFDRAAVQAIVEAAWPWVEDDPDLVEWARRFAEAGGAEAGA
jgi:hypothetical protein